MKKTLFTVLAVCFILVTNAQPTTSAKAAEVTNYKEVLSEIKYPAICKTQGIEGQVIVSIQVDAEGNLKGHRFIKYPCSDLKEAVVAVLPKLKFVAATNRHGDAVTGRVTMPIEFKLSI